MLKVKRHGQYRKTYELSNQTEINRTVKYNKEVYRRNTIYKNSYCKSLIILFILLLAFFRCLQLLLCENPLA